MSDDRARRPGESFLAHRARLKAENQRKPEPPVPATVEAPPLAGEDPGAESAPRQLTDADMPPLDSLTAESDFSQFLAEGVSDALRRAALRKLFHLPEFGVLDGLNDYDEDYTQFEKLGDVVTYHQRRMQAREAAEKAAAEREAELAGQGDAVDEEEAPETSTADASAEEVETAERPRAETSADEPLDDDADLQG